jgi:Protein of unknown function (DUF3489)
MSRMIVDPWLLSPVVNATTLKTIKHSVEMRSLRLSAPPRPRKLKILGHVREVYGCIEEMMQATDWQQHSVRGFLAGTVKKKLGFSLTASKAAGDVRRYRIETRRGR